MSQSSIMGLFLSSNFGSRTLYVSMWPLSLTASCFYEHSHNTPVCGLLQITDKEEVTEVIKLIALETDVCQVPYL